MRSHSSWAVRWSLVPRMNVRRGGLGGPSPLGMNDGLDRRDYGARRARPAGIARGPDARWNRREAVVVCNQLAPEHLQLHVTDPGPLRRSLLNYGALFLGHRTAEVLGDYGAGPNHVLPTGRASRFSGGLSVMSFLRVRTWLQIDDEQGAAGLYEDAAWFARKEGLLAHAHAAELRQRKGTRR